MVERCTCNAAAPGSNPGGALFCNSAVNDPIKSSDDYCFLAGWGFFDERDLNSVTLRQGKMKSVSKSECESHWGSLSDEVFCAGGAFNDVAACKGDSGGALICKNSEGVHRVIGITSWGQSSCQSVSKPTVFTNIKYYQEKILKNHSTTFV